MEISDATKDVSDHARSIIARQMSEVLVEKQVDLTDQAAVISTLYAAKFGPRAIAILFDAAVSIAMHSRIIQSLIAASVFYF